ncbi:MAG: ABC transporter ATP-binding protein [Bacteroidales bacterium]|nr:ABC transporter ATP-binding protein [Bacteroidales bacterium]
MIQLENISKVYQTKNIETLALDNINLEIQSGEFLSVMGPSGCGKSTLLNVMGLLDNPTKGQLILDGIAIDGYTDKALAHMRNQKLGFIFQNFHLISSLNVRDNVELPLLYRKISAPERKRRTEEILEQVGLKHRSRHFPSELSGGQCQRVAVARAIVGQPEILLADEPTGNLDSKMGEDIMILLKSLNRDLGTTIVMVTHDRALASETQRIIHLFDGRQVN